MSASPLAKLDAWLDRPASPYPQAIFRIAFYAGLAFHFFPAVFAFGDNFTRDAFRRSFVGETIYNWLDVLPTWLVVLIAVATLASIVAGILGVAPRITAAATLAGTLLLSGFNGAHTGGFVMFDAFGVLLLWTLFGGGTGALSLEAWLGSKRPMATRAFGDLLAIRIFAGLFVAGADKLLSGWPQTNVGHDLLRFPAGFVLRDWAAGASVLQSSATGYVLTALILAAELAAPVALLFKPTRMAGLTLYLLYLTTVLALFEAPVLFYTLFLGIAVFVLPETVWPARKPAVAPGRPEPARF